MTSTLPRRLSTLAWLGLAAPALGSAQGPPAAVRVDAVRQELVQEQRLVTGDVRAARRAAVATREKGIVLELPVREGGRVAAGAVLARLDARRLELERDVLRAQRLPAEAQVAEARTRLAQAESNLAALEQLAGREAARPKELTDARTARDGADAGLQRATGDLAVLEARLAELEQRMEDTVIRAPFEGTITARLVELGAWLAEGAPVVELVSTGELEAWLEVPQALFAAVTAAPGGIRVRADATGESLVLAGGRVVPDVDVRARTFHLVAPIDGSASLAAGMSLTGHVPTEEQRERLTVSNDALLRNEVGSYVYTVVPGSGEEPARAAPAQVEVLFRTADRAVVRGRLSAGAQVVVEGNERLFPMAPIQPIPVTTGGGDAGGAPLREEGR